MTRNINKVIIIGQCGHDPKTSSTPKGTEVANIHLATVSTWKDKKGQNQDKIDWHRVIFLNRLAETVRLQVRKGSQLYVEGRLFTRSWTTKSRKLHITEIIAKDLYIINSANNEKQDTSEFEIKVPSNRSKKHLPPLVAEEFDLFDGIDDDIENTLL